MHFIALKEHMADTAGRSKLASEVRQITKLMFIYHSSCSYVRANNNNNNNNNRKKNKYFNRIKNPSVHKITNANGVLQEINN